MNKIKVGNAPPPNLRVVRSKIGSLENATHKPGFYLLSSHQRKFYRWNFRFFFPSNILINLNRFVFEIGGGKVKIENKKIEFKVTSRIAAKNENYKGPAGGDKKVKDLNSFSLDLYKTLAVSVVNATILFIVINSSNCRFLAPNWLGMLNLKSVH